MKAKRFLSLLLALVMIFSLLLTGVSAATVNDSFTKALTILRNYPALGTVKDGQTNFYWKINLPEDGYINLEFNDESSGTEPVSTSSWETIIYTDQLDSLVGFGNTAGESKTFDPVGLPAGDYYVRVIAYNMPENSKFQINVHHTIAYDWETEENDDWSTADDMEPNTDLHGSIMESGDVDCFKLHLSDPGMVTFKLDHTFEGSTDSYWNLELLDYYLQPLQTYSFHGNITGEETAVPIGLPAGDFYLRMTKGSQRTTSEYVLTAMQDTENVAEQELNDTFGDATSITTDVTVHGSLQNSGDKDYYVFDTYMEEYSTGINVQLNHANLSDNHYYWRISLYNAGLDEIYSQTVTGLDDSVTLPTIGVYGGLRYIRVDCPNNSYYSAEPYSFTVTTASDVWEQEKNNSFADAWHNTLQLDESMNGCSMTTSDSDYFQLSCPDGGLMLDFSHPVLETSSAGWNVTLYDARQNRVATQYFAAKEPGGILHGGVGLKAGDYYVQVSPSQIGPETYTLTPWMDNANWELENNDSRDSSASPLLDETNTTKGNLSASGDVDYFRLQPSQAGVLELSFDHTDLQDTNTFWSLELYDVRNDVTLWSGSVSGMGSTKSWKPIGLAAGEYFLKISGNNNHYSNTTYTLHPCWTDSDEWEQEYNNPMSMPTEIQPGRTYSGGLMNSNDRDWYSFTLYDPAAFDFRFDYPQTENASGAWTVTLYTAGGTELTSWTYNEKDAVEGDHIVGLASGSYQICVSPKSYTDTIYGLTLLTPSGDWERERNDDAVNCTVMELEDLTTTNRQGNLMTINDKDWYRLDVPKDGYIRLDFQHPALNDKNNKYWEVELYASDKTTLMAARNYYGTSDGEEPWNEIGVQAGSYYVCISDPSVNYGNYYDRGVYSFSVDFFATNAHENERNDTLDTARSIQLNEGYWGNIMRSGDQDYYSFYLDDPTGVYVHFFQPEENDGQWQVNLLNSKGETIKYWTYKGSEAQGFNDMGIGLPDGQYYILVQASTWSDQIYSLQVNESSDLFEQEVNDTRAKATPVDLDISMHGTLMTLGDVDYFKFTLPSATAVRLTLSHPTDMDNASNRLWGVTLYNDTEEINYDGHSWYGDPDKDSDARWIGLEAGTYLVRISDPSQNYGNYWNGGVYTLKVETDDSLWEREQNNSYETANDLPLNQDIRGMALNSSDYYKITVPRTGFVTLHFQHDVIDNTSTLWTIRLLDDEFNEMTSFSSKGNTPGDLTTKGIGLAAGDYYVVVDSSNSDLVYTLQAEYSRDGLWEFEKNNSFGMANPLPLNQTIHGSLMSTIDVDYYQFQITEPGYVDLHFAHPRILDSANHWSVSVYNAEQSYVTGWTSNGTTTDFTKAGLGFMPGVYYVRVEKYNDVGYSDYVYELTADFTAADDWEMEQNNSTATANPISDNTPVHGLIMNSGDIDYYSFTLSAPDTVALSLQHERVDTTSNIFTVYLIDDNNNSKLSLFSKGLTADEIRSDNVNLDPGTYYVYVTGNAYTTPYTLTVHSLGTNLAKITSQPKDLVGPYGMSGSFSIGASGSGLGYQWQYSTNGGYNWRDTGYGDTTLPRTISTVNDGWLFRCVVTDEWGTRAISDAAAIRLQPTELAFVTQPKNASAQPDEEVTFFVEATGDELIYQWEQSSDGYNWKPVSGGSDSSLTVMASAGKPSMQYRCVVTDIYDHSITSNEAKLTVLLPELKITAEPEDFTGAVGTNAAFRVAAVGEELDYQWQYQDFGTTKWKNSANTSAIAVARITAARDGRLYRCVITDAYGRTVTSQAAAMYAQNTFTILEHPESASVLSGGTVDFSVAAVGDDLTYQWQYKKPTGSWTKSTVSGCKTDTITVPATMSRSGYQYRCLVTSGDETLTSEPATLYVLGIKTQPVNVSAILGETAAMKVVATGDNLSYQWQYLKDNGTWANTTITGCKTDTLSIKATAARDGNQYRCVVSNGTDTVTSAGATFTLFALKAQPQDVSATAGETVTFQVNVSGVNLTYQWQYKTPSGSWTNTTLSGNKTAALTVSASVGRNGYQYRCIVKCGSSSITSDGAALTVFGIKTQPKDVTVSVGSTTNFKVVATGDGLTYQWQVKTTTGSWKNTTLSGNKTATLKVTASAGRNGYQYRCVITDAAGRTATSKAATLTVG